MAPILFLQWIKNSARFLVIDFFFFQVVSSLPSSWWTGHGVTNLPLSGLYRYLKNVIDVLERALLVEPESKRQILRWLLLAVLCVLIDSALLYSLCRSAINEGHLLLNAVIENWLFIIDNHIMQQTHLYEETLNCFVVHTIQKMYSYQFSVVLL